MDEKKVVLPWNKPIVNIVSETDMIFSLAANNPEKYLPSIVENFINIRYKTQFSTPRFAAFLGDHSEWNRYKFLHVHAIPYWMINFNSLQDFIYEVLQQGYYIACNINTKYIHNYVNFGYCDFRHCIAIYGACGDNLYVCDYFNFKVRKNDVCSFSEFSMALQDFIDALEQKRPNFMPQLKDHLNGILLFKENNEIEGLELSKIYSELRNFLYPNSMLQQNQKISYGIEFIKVLSEDLKYDDCNHYEINYRRNLHLIYIHTKLMRIRIQYLNQHYFKENFIESKAMEHMEYSAILMRNNYIKARIKNENDIVFNKKLSDQIYEFYKIYYDYLYKFMDLFETLL